MTGKLTLSSRILQDLDRGRGLNVTWLNHYSAQVVPWQYTSEADIIGIDGTLLQLLLGKHARGVERTSADLVLPKTVQAAHARGCKILFIGGQPKVAQLAAGHLGVTAACIDGYQELREFRLAGYAEAKRYALIVVSVGPELQDQCAHEIRQIAQESVVATAGGWLDQCSRGPQYYPPWIHRYRIGWLLRLAREPRRLGRRYTIDAAMAVARFKVLRERILKDRHVTRFGLVKDGT